LKKIGGARGGAMQRRRIEAEQARRDCERKSKGSGEDDDLRGLGQGLGLVPGPGRASCEVQGGNGLARCIARYGVRCGYLDVSLHELFTHRGPLLRRPPGGGPPLGRLELLVPAPVPVDESDECIEFLD
jgi:hypothetical protein